MKRGLLAIKTGLQKNKLPVQATEFFPTSFFNLYTIVRVLLVTGLMIFFLQVYGQPEPNFKKILTDRSEKIVNTLHINDSGIYEKLVECLVNQYINVNAIHERAKTSITEIKLKALSAEATQAEIKLQEEKKSSQLLQLHEKFLAHLKKSLTNEQVEMIKDGMTYRVFPITYAAYQDMLPGLTAKQKEKIYGWLKEARELAMDEGSSEDKHKVFGKYKGKINNYLSAEGYDMKKEGEEWQKRTKEREAKTKEQKSS
ncbi:MAG: DUF3826 domain-containing protein [Chitinophagales bacterium]